MVSFAPPRNAEEKARMRQAELDWYAQQENQLNQFLTGMRPEDGNETPDWVIHSDPFPGMTPSGPRREKSPDWVISDPLPGQRREDMVGPTRASGPKGGWPPASDPIRVKPLSRDMEYDGRVPTTLPGSYPGSPGFDPGAGEILDYDPRSEEERWRSFQKDGRLSFNDMGWPREDYINRMTKKYGETPRAIETHLDPKIPRSDGTPGVPTATGPRPPRSDGTPGFNKTGPGRMVVGVSDPKPFPPSAASEAQVPTEDGRSYTNNNGSQPQSTPMSTPRFAGNLPLTGLLGSIGGKGRRGGRLGRGGAGGETPVYGGGIGGGNVSNINIEANPVQSNIQTSQLGPTALTAAGEDAVSTQTATTQTDISPSISTGTGVGTPSDEATGDEALMPRVAPGSHRVGYREDYTGDLSGQAAAGKATQLLRRAIGEQGIKSQGDFNKYFEPLYKDLQTGGDYGQDIGRFYENIRKEGRTPYQDNPGWKGALGQGAAYDPVGGSEAHKGGYRAFVEQAPADNFYDMADYGRRMLEGKAYYRPGGVGTNLDRIGQIENTIRDKQGTGWNFKGKTTPYGGGYRAGVVPGELGTGGNAGGAWQEYYERYLQGY